MISPFLLAHIVGGTVGIASGFAALFVRKGSRLHRKTGDVFVVSMLFMAGSGALMALMKSQPGNVMAGVFTCYLVATAWLTVRRKQGERGRTEIVLLVVALAAGAGAFILGWLAAHGATALRREGPVAMYFVFGSAAFLSAAGDLRLVIRGGVSGVQRLVRHLWRMCVALFVATGSFFLGTSSNPLQLRARLFTHAIRQTHLPEVPVLLLAGLTIFWLFRVRFAKAYRKTARETAPRRGSSATAEGAAMTSAEVDARVDDQRIVVAGGGVALPRRMSHNTSR
jgi:uncharacterized membrane protein